MPRGDGTGPMGAGAMTGRGGGYCTGARGRGLIGGGRGGWGGRFCSGGWGARLALPPFRPAWPSGEAESNLLQNQAQALQAELERIKTRLAQLSGGQKED